MEVSKLQTYVKEIIKDCIKNNELFAAYDVTKKIRDICNTLSQEKENVPHHFVKAEISNLWQKDGFISLLPDETVDYHRSVIDLNIGKKTVLFHPSDKDPKTYHAAMQENSTEDINQLPSV